MVFSVAWFFSQAADSCFMVAQGSRASRTRRKGVSNGGIGQHLDAAQGVKGGRQGGVFA